MVVLEFGRGCRRNLGGEREKGEEMADGAKPL